MCFQKKQYTINTFQSTPFQMFNKKFHSQQSRVNGVWSGLAHGPALSAALDHEIGDEAFDRWGMGMVLSLGTVSSNAMKTNSYCQHPHGCFPKIRGTPKWMVYSGKPHQNGWFGGTTIFGNTHIPPPHPKTSWHFSICAFRTWIFSPFLRQQLTLGRQIARGRPHKGPPKHNSVALQGMVWHGVGKTQTIAVFLGDNDFSSLF